MKGAGIEITNLSKVYGTKKKPAFSVRDLTLSIPEGSVFGFLGPNGAGKTTTIKMLVGLTKPTQGSVFLSGGSPYDKETRRMIGFMPETPAFYLYLTGREFLEFIADIFSLEDKATRIDQLLSLVDLQHAEGKQIRTYSKGMIQRLGLAQALINDPQIIFLDEPLDGLDPIGRAEIKKIIVDLKAQKKTIFLNTHILSDVAEVCDYVGIIDKGVLITSGTPHELTQGYKDLEDAFVHIISHSRKEA